MAAQDQDLSTQVFHDPNWIATWGGWIHANNVLFYFAQSPFYSAQSGNGTIMLQNTGFGDREARFLATRQKFEAELLNHTGIQYVVAVDPLESKVMIPGPGGQPEPSDMWVIRKQNRLERRKVDAIKILDYYYIIDQKIFQAPRVDSIVDYRMMNSLLAMDKIVKIAADLPKFSASHGHTYFTPGQRSASAVIAGSARQSRIGTPMPIDDASATTTVVQDAHGDVHGDGEQSDEQTLREALRMTLTYGDQFYEDAPLIGEPGNFRYAKPKDLLQHLKVPDLRGSTRSVTPSKASTPAPQPIEAPSSPASLSGNFEPSEAQEATKSKPKRKKSVAANNIG